MPRIDLILMLFMFPVPLLAAETTLINRNLNGNISGPAEAPAISADGSTIAFRSTATDLLGVGLDTNGTSDIFVYDRTTDTMEIVSVNSAGEQSDGFSFAPSISATGRYVAFSSGATNLNPISTSGNENVYVHDRQTDTTTLVSKNSLGQPVSGRSFDPSISADGRYIAYTSSSAEIVDLDFNAVSDIFLYDRLTSTNIKVSVQSGGAPGTGASTTPVISANGRYIAFASMATNFETFDNNGVADIYRHDTQTNTTQAVSVLSSVQIDLGGMLSVVNEIGTAFSRQPAISANGQFIAFATRAENLHGSAADIEQIVVKNMATSAQFADPELISANASGQSGNGISTVPSISSDAQYVNFASRASNLVDIDSNDNWDFYLFNRDNDNMELLSVNNDGVPGLQNGQSITLRTSQRRISDNGRFVTFSAFHANLVQDDTDLDFSFINEDVFLRDRGDACDPAFAGSTRTLPSNTWLLAALPCTPPSSQNTVEDILADDITGALGTSWAVFTYDPTLLVPAYVPATLSTPLEPGQGFWIQQLTGDDVTLDMPSGSRQVTGRMSAPASACISSNGCFEVAISGAPNNSFLWNMIGNPYLNTNQVAFNDLRVTAASGSCAANPGCTMAEAADADIVFNRFFHHDENGYTNREAGSTLSAWEGYWVPELSLSEFNTPLIRFPR